MQALIYVVSAALYFLATLILSRDRSSAVLLAVLIPGAVNSAVIILEEWKLWNPIEFEAPVEDFLRSSGLIGNPNDVGMYLLPVCLSAAAFAVSANGWWRAAGLTFALLAFGALIVTGTLTALVALVPSSIILIWLASRRWGIVAAIACPLAGLAALTLYAPLRNQLETIVAAAVVRDYDTVFTGRGAAFLAAIEMAKDRPFTGVGPGAFAWQYFPYKTEVQQAHPALLNSRAVATMWEEAHNDHLETAAEAEIFGYVLFLACLSALARCSLTHLDSPRVGGEIRPAFSRLISLPLAVSLFVLALAQFPFQVASGLTVYLYLAALAMSWSHAKAW